MPRQKPKPRKVRELEGNPSKRPLPVEPEMADLRDSDPPKHLCRYGKEEWRRVMGAIPDGLVTAADIGALSAMCAKYGRWRKAYARLLALGDGDVIETKTGYCLPHPLVAIEQKSCKDYLAAAAEFGLTPSARTRVSVKPKDDASGVKRRFFRHEEAG